MKAEFKPRPTFRVVTPIGVSHGKDTKVFDDDGRDISHLVRRVEVTLDCQALNSAKVEMFPSVEVTAQLDELVVITHQCLKCCELDKVLIEVTTFGDEAKRFVKV